MGRAARRPGGWGPYSLLHSHGHRLAGPHGLGWCYREGRSNWPHLASRCAGPGGLRGTDSPPSQSPPEAGAWLSLPFPNEEPEATCSGPRSWYVGCRDLSPAVHPQVCAALGPGGAVEGGGHRVLRGLRAGTDEPSQSRSPPHSRGPRCLRFLQTLRQRHGRKRGTTHCVGGKRVRSFVGFPGANILTASASRVSVKWQWT